MTILNRLCEAITGSRELDAMIAVSLQIMPSNAFQPCASSDAGTFGTGAHTFWRAPEYTTSIDAALALVEKMLPGWQVYIGIMREENGGCVVQVAPNQDATMVKGKSAPLSHPHRTVYSA